MYIDELCESKRLTLSAVSGLDPLQIPYRYDTHHRPKSDQRPMSTLQILCHFLTLPIIITSGPCQEIICLIFYFYLFYYYIIFISIKIL